MTCDIPRDQDVGVVDGGARDVCDAGHVLPVPGNTKIGNNLKDRQEAQKYHGSTIRDPKR